MEIQNLLVLLAALLVTKPFQVSAQCPTECTCDSMDEAYCDDVTAPPPGYWPNIAQLYLQNSKIVKLENYALAGFPNIANVWLNGSPLEEMHMGAFAACPLLSLVFAAQTPLRTILPPLPGQTFPSLQFMYISEANLTSLPEDLLVGSQIEMLDASDNPLLTLPADRPLVTSSTLQDFRLQRTGGGRISKTTFQGIPNVQKLYISKSNIFEIGDAFSTLENIETLQLLLNPVEEIKKGAFSPNAKIAYLDLYGTALKTLEIAAVDGIVTGSLDITGTPLACSCLFEELYWWAQAKNVKLNYYCENANCNFQERQLDKKDYGF